MLLNSRNKQCWVIFINSFFSRTKRNKKQKLNFFPFDTWLQRSVIVSFWFQSKRKESVWYINMKQFCLCVRILKSFSFKCIFTSGYKTIKFYFSRIWNFFSNRNKAMWHDWQWETSCQRPNDVSVRNFASPYGLQKCTILLPLCKTYRIKFPIYMTK